VSKASKTHRSDEFGRPTSLSGPGSMSPWDRRSLTAPSRIAIDGKTENESGVTPPPPPFSLKALIVALVVMLLVGIVIMIVLLQYGPDFTP
jgi:hypothetical protein